MRACRADKHVRHSTASYNDASLLGVVMTAVPGRFFNELGLPTQATELAHLDYNLVVPCKYIWRVDAGMLTKRLTWEVVAVI